MKLKDKIKSYSFWVSIASAVILILKVLGNRFNFVVDESMVSDLFTALCSILVLLGIIVVPSSQNSSNAKSLSNEQPAEDEISTKQNTFLNQINSNTQNLSNQISNETNQTSEKQTESLDNESIEKINSINKDNCNQISNEQLKVLQDEQNKNSEMTPENFLESSTEVSTENQEPQQSLNNNSNELLDFKKIFEENKEKFSGNLNEYLSFIQEEIKKLREKM